jgi:hypothetical protein
MFEGKARTYAGEAAFRSSILGRLLALPTNIRLYWINLPRTNNLAYYPNAKITAVESFMTLGPGPNILKLFYYNLQMLVVSWSVCPSQAFPVKYNMCVRP